MSNAVIFSPVHVLVVALSVVFLGCTKSLERVSEEHKPSAQAFQPLSGIRIFSMEEPYPVALSDLSDYTDLFDSFKEERAARLLSFDDFLKLAKDSATIVLDARSRHMYEGKHLAGAVNLPFTEFTQGSLHALLGGYQQRILIYCNNNFNGDAKYFRSKQMRSPVGLSGTLTPRMLALNVPTHVTLRGYGYKNVYELNEYVHIEDERVQMEGSAMER